MNNEIESYYKSATGFKKDILSYVKGLSEQQSLPGDSEHPYFGWSWKAGGSDLRRLNNVVPEERRPKFLVCLYFTILVDQAMHAHFGEWHEPFTRMAGYPNFLSYCLENQNPVQILTVPVDGGCVKARTVEPLLEPGMKLFVDETVNFFESYMPKIQPVEFFKKLLSDPDVQSPDCFVDDSHDLGKKVYAALKSAVDDRTGALL